MCVPSHSGRNAQSAIVITYRYNVQSTACIWPGKREMQHAAKVQFAFTEMFKIKDPQDCKG